MYLLLLAIEICICVYIYTILNTYIHIYMHAYIATVNIMDSLMRVSIRATVNIMDIGDIFGTLRTLKGLRALCGFNIKQVSRVEPSLVSYELPSVLWVVGLRFKDEHEVLYRDCIEAPASVLV